MADRHHILIGSIGDDSHSIGMALLEIALQECGYGVRNIGILNDLDDFFYIADQFEAIFISCMNGHADLYLEDFPRKLNLFRNGNSHPRLWYLGGNLSVKESGESVIRKYLARGFDFVAPKPLSFETIRERLVQDFDRKGIKPRNSQENLRLEYPPLVLDALDDRPMPEAEFALQREKVLSSWPTGSEVRQADKQAAHADPSKNLHHLIRSRPQGRKGPLVQPRTGVAHTQDEIGILQYLRKHGLEVSSIQLDAASRKNIYAKAAEGVQRTEPGTISMLNGYPVPVHGVEGIRRILAAIDTPFQIRAGSPDHRLVYEIGLAGGTSSLEGGFLCYLFPYDKKTSPAESLQLWKYVDRLAAGYHAHYKAVINREYFGPLTCCLVEPSLPIAINIVQAILSARSGVTCISVGLAEQGNRIQDIAAQHVLRTKTRQALDAHGLSGITLSTVFHQFMAAFPTDRAKACDLIRQSSITAALAGADRIMTKTPVESIHIPTKENNAEGLALTREGIRMARDIRFDRAAVQWEIDLLSEEVDALLRYILTVGKGSYARGSLAAFRDGVLDIPFSPSIFNRGELKAAKDSDGAVRFINPERMPFSEHIKDFHRERISARMTLQRTTRIYECLEHDLTRIWQNDYLRWPLDGHYIH